MRKTFFSLAIPLALVGLSYAVFAEPENNDNESAPSSTDHIVRFDDGISVHLDDDERVEIEGEVLGGQTRMLEFLVVTRSGPTHEALVSITGKAYDIRQGLEILGLKCGDEKLRFRGDPMQPKGPEISVSVQWRDSDNARHEIPIEDWVMDLRTKKAMERGPWIFTGSISHFRDDLNRDVFAADQVSSVIALWHDPSCVIDNPREGGAIADIYSPNPEADIPPPGTKVKLVLRRFKHKAD